MRTLVIDTATAACSVALIEDGAVVDGAYDVVGRGHAERLVPMIAALPGAGRADRILVDVGPGSFTGVRVGIAAARGLAIGWGVPAFGYSSLALIAAAAFADDAALSTVAAVLEGGHGEVFLQRFAAPLTEEGPLASLRPDDAVDAVQGAFVVGNGLARLRATGANVSGRDTLPDARDAVALPAGFAALPPRPIYGRPPDAVPARAR